MTTKRLSQLIEEARTMVDTLKKLFDKSPLVKGLGVVFDEIPKDIPAIQVENEVAFECPANLMEQLAAIEHDRWSGQARTALDEMTPERRERWNI